MQSIESPFQVSVAPMMGWTDRHCRFFLRQVSPTARLFTPMLHCNALLLGDAARYLNHHPSEQPIAIQLGGSDQAQLAAAAKLAEQWRFVEINLNCGCPSGRVRAGAFGASMMLNPKRVAQCLRAMRDAVDLPISVKHRVGVDQSQGYEFVSDFLGQCIDAGCNTFVVHARSAWLNGLSPKQNRSVPPLDYGLVHRLKSEFKDCTIVINGGFKHAEAVLEQRGKVDGVMIGRAAYRQPWLLRDLHVALHGSTANLGSREQIAETMLRYIRDDSTHGRHAHAITRHMHGLYHEQPGARKWRQQLQNFRMN